jgi:hypothetical protein
VRSRRGVAGASQGRPDRRRCGVGEAGAPGPEGGDGAAWPEVLAIEATRAWGS